MGIGGIGIWQLLIILLIILLLFGGKKLRNLGSDLGAGIKSFKKSMADGEKEEGQQDSLEDKTGGEIIDAEVKHETKDKV